MAEKWEVIKRPFEREIVRSVEYGVYAKNGKELVANVANRKDAQKMAASPLMLEALKAAREYVSNTTTDCRECGELNSSSSRDKTIDIIDAAIAAAKGV
jgi:hypothetical protein